MSTIGSRIRTLRRRTGLTQEAFAPTINISRGYLAKLEADIREPSKKLIRFIAEKYGVTIEWLLTGQGQEYIDGRSDAFPSPAQTMAETLRQRMASAEEQMATLKMQLAALLPETADNRLRAMINQVVRIYHEGDPRKLIPLKSLLDLTDPDPESERRAGLEPAPDLTGTEVPTPTIHEPGEDYRSE